MKAMMFDDFGDPDVLRLVDVEPPVPGPGQVRIRVMTAGVNPLDGKIRSGVMRAMMPTTLPMVPGFEAAGVVDAVGEGVHELTRGQEVLGWTDTGAYAEHALASQVVTKPARLSWDAAVTLPVASEAAMLVLDRLNLTKGDTLLVNGAAGAVGTMAVQLAVAAGITVIGTAGPANQDYLASLGATPTRYGEGLVDRVRALAPRGVDAVFDVAGKGALPDSIALAGGAERVVTIADPTAAEHGVVFAAGDPAQRQTTRLANLAERAARGELVTTVAGRYPLAEAAAAQRISDAGHARGKLVLTVG